MSSDLGQRIVIVGTPGAGKTTLARQIAVLCDLPHVELDALHWGPGWSVPPEDEFRAQVGAALAGDAWVVDGNYSKVRDVIWPRADTLIWLDFPLRVVVPRLVWRSLRRVVTRQELWNGNRESWRVFWGRDSLVLYAFTSHFRRRRTYPPLFEQYDHLRVIRLRSPRALRAWLLRISAGCA